MSTATETATIHEAATKRIEKKMGEFERLIAPAMAKIYSSQLGDLTMIDHALFNPIDRGYEDAKSFIREVAEAYQ